MNSEFSFPETSCLPKTEDPSLSYYLPIDGGRIIGFIPFPRVLVLCEMQSVSSRIWTRVAVFISYNDNNYTTGTSTHHGHVHYFSMYFIIVQYCIFLIVIDTPDGWTKITFYFINFMIECYLSEKSKYANCQEKCILRQVDAIVIYKKSCHTMEIWCVCIYNLKHAYV